MVKNLAQLKRALVPGAGFEIVDNCRPHFIGQRRTVTSVNSVGVFSTLPAEPDSEISRANDGRGHHLAWMKASNWQFCDDGTCILRRQCHPLGPPELAIALKLLDYHVT